MSAFGKPEKKNHGVPQKSIVNEYMLEDRISGDIVENSVLSLQEVKFEYRYYP